MLRGINRQIIFEDDADCELFLDIILTCKELSRFKLLGYCLMENHVHLLLELGEESLGKTLKRIAVRYVVRFNGKYGRSGHLFQDRYKSEPVEDDEYLLSALRYVHQNPVKAGMCGKLEDHPWSSYHDYMRTDRPVLSDTKEILSMFSKTTGAQRREFQRFMEMEEARVFLDPDHAPRRYSDKELKEAVKSICGVMSAAEFQALPNGQRDKNLHMLRKAGFSIRQVSRITGVPFGIVRSK